MSFISLEAYQSRYNNQIFGKLKIINITEKIKYKNSKGYEIKAKLLCYCGKKFIANLKDVKRNKSKSCGCLRSILAKNLPKPKHGFAKKIPEYFIWSSMRDRCNSPSHISYKNYGERGIKVCAEWNDFSVFLKDMGRRPSPKHQIDRKKNNEGYSKDNCHWTTSSVNNANKRHRKSSCLSGVRKKKNGKYSSQFQFTKDSKIHYEYLGTFACPLLASIKYQMRHIEVYGF